MLKQVCLHFYGELNDFLPDTRRNIKIIHELKKPGSIKDLIESIGVPHTEIDLIFVNSQSVDFSYQVKDGDNIMVYPPSTKIPDNLYREITINISLKHNYPDLSDISRFVLDVHLGRLAAYMRLLGFDTLYRNDYDDPTLANISADESRILLTCDRKLLMRKQISYGYFVRERQPHQQLLEVVARFDLFNKQQPFTRCAHCNGEIRAVRKKEIEEHLLPKTKRYYNEFFQCGSCSKIYWKGSHYKKIQTMMNKIKVSTKNNK